MFILKDEGYKVFIATDFEDSISKLDKREFDLVIADIMLGNMTGIDLLREIKERGLKCPVVMVTGVPSLETATEAVRLGAYDYIPKPVKGETLIRVALMALRFKKLNDQYEDSWKNLEAIFSSVKDAIICIDNNFNIIELNNAAEMIYGLRRNAIGNSVATLFRHDSTEILDVLKTTVMELRAMDVRHIECNYIDKPKKIINLNTYPLIRNNEEVSGAVMIIKDETRLNDLERELKERRQFQKIIGSSSKMQDIYTLIEDLASVDSAVLITGESGTGKELIAEAVHYTGLRKDRQLIKVNCAALSDNLLDSELFGHVKGAFTGALSDRDGRFKLADGGTIFLDEIGDISAKMQAKLLRVLQEKEFERLGESITKTIDLRIVAATNRDLKLKIKRGEFRDDLFYRLKVVEIKVPPLRERKEDIPFLVEHFLEKLSRKFNKKIIAVSREVMERFVDYCWPGNIRELEHELEHACVRCRKPVIALDDL